MLKEAALTMFTSVPGVFGNQQNNYLDLIKQMLTQSLQPQGEYEVRFQAVRAVSAFILINDKETQILKHFADLLEPMLVVIAESIQQHDDDTLLKVSRFTPLTLTLFFLEKIYRKLEFLYHKNSDKLNFQFSKSLVSRHQ